MVVGRRDDDKLRNETVAELLAGKLPISLDERSFSVLSGRPVVHDGINVHSHPELCFTVRSVLLVETHTGTERLEPGRTLVVPPSVYHFAHAETSTALTLWFACGENHMSVVLSQMRRDGKWSALDSADLSDFPDGSRLLREVIVEYESKRSHWIRFCENTIERLVLLVERELDSGPRIREEPHRRGSNLAERARGFILDNFTKELSLEDVAHQIGISPNYLANLYKARFGTTVNRSIADARLAEALRLLERTDKPISAIADEVGYINPSYFSRMFRRQTGRSPSEYRLRVG